MSEARDPLYLSLIGEAEALNALDMIAAMVDDELGKIAEQGG